MTLETDHALSQDATFRKKIEVAISRQAKAIQGESQGTLRKRQWDKRQSLATRVLDSPNDWIGVFSLHVASDAAITSSSTDTDIENKVSDVWEDIAGVTGQDLL
jgi:hypothetical protein